MVYVFVGFFYSKIGILSFPAKNCLKDIEKSIKN